MSEPPEPDAWHFYRFGLLVTGEGEAEFLPSLFGSLMSMTGCCHFEVIRKIGQRSPIRSEKRVLKMMGTNQVIPDIDEVEIGLPARHYLRAAGEHAFVLLIDDLEGSRASEAQAVYKRYRDALDTMLRSDAHRASVHFLTNMIEAYYFAHADAVNAVLKTSLTDHDGDVEKIPHPKNKLKKLKPGFDEKRDGKTIVERLDVAHVLGNPVTCTFLRTLFAWCAKAIGASIGDEYRIETGIYSIITGPQLARL